MFYPMQSERHFSASSNDKEMVRNYSEKRYWKKKNYIMPIYRQFPSVFLGHCAYQNTDLSGFAEVSIRKRKRGYGIKLARNQHVAKCFPNRVTI